MAAALCLGGSLLRPAAAQPSARPFPYDSLRATLHQPGLVDTERVYRALEACQALMYARPDSSRAYAEQALALAQRTNFVRGQANAYGGLAGLDHQAHRYASAQQRYLLMLRAAQQAHHAGLIGGAYAGMASLAMQTGNVPAGLRYYARARRTFANARPRNYNNEALITHNLANHYLEHQQYNQAAPLVRQAVALLPRCNWPELPPAVDLLLGTVQQHAQQPDSAAATWQLLIAPHSDLFCSWTTVYKTTMQLPRYLQIWLAQRYKRNPMLFLDIYLPTLRSLITFKDCSTHCRRLYRLLNNLLENFFALVVVFCHLTVSI